MLTEVKQTHSSMQRCCCAQLLVVDTISNSLVYSVALDHDAPPLVSKHPPDIETVTFNTSRCSYCLSPSAE